MSSTTTSKVKRKTTGFSRSVLQMSAQDARRFFLKPESYCSVDLPPYIAFDGLLKAVEGALSGNPLSGQLAHSPRDSDHVNHVMLSNKDGKYAWRPLQLCHPALYVALVDELTSPSTWKVVTKRFTKFFKNDQLRCLSVPVESTSKQSDRAEQVKQWWLEIEQKSIELALDFEVLIHADVTDCYGAIYTHSIAWALHSKKVAKNRRRDDTLAGNVIDSRLQDMRHGQTNGIPQGSVLMDFIAELVLGYADMFISFAIRRERIGDYRVLRYRDDYRIFANSSRDGECVLKCISEMLATLGLKLNTSKTVLSREVISDSIKPDKLRWLGAVKEDKNLAKHLLLIHDHGRQFPNSGSLVAALTEYHRLILKERNVPRQLMQLISIVVDIAFHSPKVYPVTMAILSKLLSLLASKEQKQDIINRILKKFSRIPNTGYLEIWLQRVALPFGITPSFQEPLCHLVEGKVADIWDNQWISSKTLKKALDAREVIDRERIKKLERVIPEKEIRLFEY
jgi:RNA-directed DNA polymerase